MVVVCICSLYDNNIGDEGAKHIGEAVQLSKTLTTLEYVVTGIACFVMH